MTQKAELNTYLIVYTEREFYVNASSPEVAEYLLSGLLSVYNCKKYMNPIFSVGDFVEIRQVPFTDLDPLQYP